MSNGRIFDLHTKMLGLKKLSKYLSGVCDNILLFIFRIKRIVFNSHLVDVCLLQNYVPIYGDGLVKKYNFFKKKLHLQ